MKNSIAIAGVVAVLVFGGWYLRGSVQETGGEAMGQKDARRADEGAMMKSDAMMKPEGTAMVKEDGTMMEKDGVMAMHGTYEAYAPAKLSAAEKGAVVLFFRASWCPTCRALDADIRAHLAAIPAGVTILDVNYDTATDLKKKYGVTYQHTMVRVAADGSRIAQWSGSPTLAALLTEIK